MNKIQKRILLNMARLSIETYLTERQRPIIKEEDYPDSALWKDGGAFVTLTLNNKLRGCIGTIVSVRPLILDVSENAINAAFNDPRFYPLTDMELPLTNIEVSVLTVPQVLLFSDPKDLFAKIRVGIDGVIIRNGPFQSTFLPQVWKELPDKQSFFAHLCMKAGMNEDCLTEPEVKIYTYQVEAFSEKDFK